MAGIADERAVSGFLWLCRCPAPATAAGLAALAAAATFALVTPMRASAQSLPAPTGESAGEMPTPTLPNPLNRNPGRRSGLSDAAPVMQDERNSTSRPTLPAAPGTPDSRDTVLPAPNGAFDTRPALPAEIKTPAPEINCPDCRKAAEEARFGGKTAGIPMDMGVASY